jgi:hypothetical protein
MRERGQIIDGYTAICRWNIIFYSHVPGPWPFFQFFDPIHIRWDSLGGGSARRKATTYTQNNTNTE